MLKQLLCLMMLVLSSVICDEILSEDASIPESKSDSIYMVATKWIGSNTIAKKIPFKVIYSIYNIGQKNLRDIKLVDNSFDKRYFKLKNGPIEASWDVIFPGDHVSFSTVIEPNPKLNSFNVSSAIVKYSVDSETSEMIMRTSGHGSIVLIDTSSYFKINSSHIIQWVVYILLVALILAGPYHAVKKLNKKYSLKSKKL